MDKSAPFFITELHTGDWASRLGFILPSEYRSENLDLSVDKLATFEGALRDSGTQSCYANEYWVYVSHWGWPEISPWDVAFVQLLEYHSANPLSNETEFSHV